MTSHSRAMARNNNAVIKDLDRQIISYNLPFTVLVKAKHYYDNFHQLEEINSLLDALSGKHVKVTTGGDPIRNPEVVPTGYNLYGFDPAKAPTKAAWEAGTKLTDTLIADYYQEHGHYPKKNGFLSLVHRNYASLRCA